MNRTPALPSPPSYTGGPDADPVPSRALILPPERAVAALITAVDRGLAQHRFPRRSTWPTALGQLLAVAVRWKVPRALVR